MLYTKFSISNKGVSLYFAVIILSVLLAIVLGIAAILVGQIRVIREMGDSVTAFFAADACLEGILYEDKLCRQPGCAELDFACVDTVDCDDGLSSSESPVSGNVGEATCLVSFNNGALSITSVGTFNGIKRALQVNR